MSLSSHLSPTVNIALPEILSEGNNSRESFLFVSRVCMNGYNIDIKVYLFFKIELWKTEFNSVEKRETEIW